MSVTFINSTDTITFGSPVYFIDATNNDIVITIPSITNDFLFCNFVRVDNSSYNVSFSLNDQLISGETSFNFYGFSNVSFMSYSSNWHLVSGYTKDR
jgi:hypothetical protein